MSNFFTDEVKARFFDSLKDMGEGMLCIFIVIGVIILSIYGMNAIMNKLAERSKPKDDE